MNGAPMPFLPVAPQPNTPHHTIDLHSTSLQLFVFTGESTCYQSNVPWIESLLGSLRQKQMKLLSALNLSELLPPLRAHLSRRPFFAGLLVRRRCCDFAHFRSPAWIRPRPRPRSFLCSGVGCCFHGVRCWTRAVHLQADLSFLSAAGT